MQALPMRFADSVEILVEVVAKVSIERLLDHTGMTAEQWNALPGEVQYEILCNREIRESACELYFGDFGRRLVNNADDIITQVEQPESLERVMRERGFDVMWRMRQDNQRRAKEALEHAEEMAGSVQ